ncbi:MAG: DUF2779 domain-containing protein [Candidatus Peribacteraceae bacterium]|nr:DUF2779 domain-containing protein [Candidatus Peribacteraceae bacterium]
MFLTKSDYVQHYLTCPIHLWLKKHRKEELEEEIDAGLEWIFEQGNLVETQARLLFPGAVLVGGHSVASERQTKKLVQAGKKTLFQATAIADRLMAMADVLKFDSRRKQWDIYEVKSSTEVKEDHIHDICFQRTVFRKAGYPIGKVHLVHVNNTYVRKGKIVPGSLMTAEDVTKEADELEDEVEANIEKALAVLDLKDVQSAKECTCSPKDCPCLPYCYPRLPTYSVFDLNRLRYDNARELYDSGVRRLTDIPSDFDGSDAQLCQLKVARTGKPIIEKEKIRRALSALKYPLFFLDYETFFPATPMFDGYRPYQQMVFQYSLHIVPAPDAPLEHKECLVRELLDPVPVVLKQLAQDIGPRGSVIVWNKGFEMSRNEEMAHHVPKYAKFLRSVNKRVFDLMEIFRHQHCVHPDFRGSCSIKDVLPVLVPHLSYDNLAIHEGGGASLAWYRMFGKPKAEQEVAQRNLLEYCKLDTFAMVEIFRFLLALKEEGANQSATITLTPKKESKGLPLG